MIAVKYVYRRLHLNNVENSTKYHSHLLQPAIAPVFLASEIIINIYFQLRGHEGASEQLPDDCPPSAKKSDNDCPPPPKRKKSVAPSPEEIMVSTYIKRENRANGGNFAQT